MVNPRTAEQAPGTDPAYERPSGKLVLRLTITCHKGGTWEMSATRADGSTVRRRGMEYDSAWFAAEDEIDALHDAYLARSGVS